ncbi:hypothetical protein CEXT_310031 [Caerostris extrusa]|uniref:Uncharacterized protein n=1 Tax=Caerostris extrusa TaxID=172846 RepID=A0AAV4P6I6_CAEEX|nr:hypothetical protein CEXT_310031 [Caerostris extrusa]
MKTDCVYGKKVHGFGTYFGRVVEKSHFPCFTRLKVVVIRISVDFLGTATCPQERTNQNTHFPSTKTGGNPDQYLQNFFSLLRPSSLLPPDHSSITVFIGAQPGSPSVTRDSGNAMDHAEIWTIKPAP